MLGVVIPYFDYVGDELRRKNTIEFLKRLDKLTETKVVLVEAVTENPELRLPNTVNRYLTEHAILPVKTKIWRKENLINIGEKYLPIGCTRIAWLDSDLILPDGWDNKVNRALDKHEIIQVFETAYLLQERLPSADIKTTAVGAVKVPSVAACWCRGINAPQENHPLPGHTGLGWAMRRDVFKNLGGLPELAIVGGGDTEIACAVFGRLQHVLKYKSLRHWEAIWLWASRAARLIKCPGYASTYVHHEWHGDEDKRQYYSRTKILIDGNYDPMVDTMHDENGVLELSEIGMRLQPAINAYFQARI